MVDVGANGLGEEQVAEMEAAAAAMGRAEAGVEVLEMCSAQNAPTDAAVAPPCSRFRPVTPL